MKFEVLKSHHKKYNIGIVAHWALDGVLGMDILDTLLMKWKRIINMKLTVCQP